jgi:hypothetical protein
MTAAGRLACRLRVHWRPTDYLGGGMERSLDRYDGGPWVCAGCGETLSEEDYGRRARGMFPTMGIVLTVLAVVLAIFGVVNLLEGDLLWGLILLLAAALVGPGGYSVFRGRY